MAPLVEPLERAREQALETVRWVSTFDMPDFEQDYEFVALRHPSEYPFNEGRLVSNKGLDIAIRDYDEHFVEEHVAHSNALHSALKGRGAYFVGPMARYSLNFDRLPATRAAGRSRRTPFVCLPQPVPEHRGPCRGGAFTRSTKRCGSSRPTNRPRSQPCAPRPLKAPGYGCTEAPRGILFHRYRLNADGTIADAKIVPPTSQNQKAIENDLGRFVERHLQLPNDALTWKCEQAVRNYDPCISCATHFLRLQVDRHE